MSLTIDEVRKIAFLSRIDVEEERLEELSGNLSSILDWVELLQKVDVDNIEPLASPIEFTQPMRKDEVTDGGYQQKVLSNTKHAEDGYYTVPKVVE